MILLMMRVNLHEVEKWFFKDFLIFVSFRNGTTNRHEIKKYVKNFKNKYYKHIKRQNFYKRKKFINPRSWQEVSKNYLNEIRFNSNRLLFETFKSFRLFAGDGYDFDLPETDEIKEEISVKDTWMKKNPTQAKFSSWMY